MFEAPVEPLTPPRPEPREIKYGDPMWVLENVPVNPSFSTRVAWQAVELLRKLECTEVKNFWGPDRENTPSKQKPARSCQDLRDNKWSICVKCHGDQSRAVMLPESMIIEQSQLFCCLDCVKKIESRAVTPNGVGRLHIDYCNCVWQVSQTWLCHLHRKQAHQLVAGRVGVGFQAYLTRYGRKVYPGCKVKRGFSRSKAWQCSACETFVYDSKCCMEMCVCVVILFL